MSSAPPNSSAIRRLAIAASCPRAWLCAGVFGAQAAEAGFAFDVALDEIDAVGSTGTSIDDDATVDALRLQRPLTGKRRDQFRLAVAVAGRAGRWCVRIPQR